MKSKELAALLEQVDSSKDDFYRAKEALDNAVYHAWDQWKADNPNADTLTRFNAWFNIGPKTQESMFVKHFEASDGLELFGDDDCSIVFAEKNELITYTKVFECLVDAHKNYNEYYAEQSSVEELMEQVIEYEFKSMIYDW